MKKSVILRRIIAIILCALLLLFPLCSCRGKSKNVNWLLSTAPKNLDPQTAEDESELLIIKNCFTGLFEKNADGELFSSFVKKYDVSESGKTYVFHLYDDKKWSFYEKRKVKEYGSVTAHDFAFAIKRVFTDAENCDIMNVLRFIKGADKALENGDVSSLAVSCPDDFTLKIELTEKNSALIEAFTNYRLFPCNEQFFNSTSGKYGLTYDSLIFNGAFVLSDMGESSVKLIKNSNAPFEVKAAGVTLYLPKATREHVALLKEGDIDAANLSFEQFDMLKDSKVFNYSERNARVWALVFNKDDPLWQNENLRKAVATCIDRTVLKGKVSHISPANRLFSDTTLLYSKNYLKLTKNVSTGKYNAENAKVLYAAALLELELSKIYNTSVLVCDLPIYKDSFSSLNQIFQRELSLYFSLEGVEQSALIKRVKSGEFSAAVVPLNISGDTPFSMLEYFYKNSAVCILPIENEEFTQNFASAEDITNEDSAPLYANAEQILYDTALVNPLYFEKSYFVSSNSVSGFESNVEGITLFKNVNKK